MQSKPRILAFAGSAREKSLNKRLMHLAASAARSVGAEVTEMDFQDLPLPLYDPDREEREGIPENVRKFKALLKSHQGLLIACPEYNSTITPLLKNAIDWASRKEEEEKPLECFTGKVAALYSASPGALGGLRGLVHVRAILSNIGVLVLPDQLAIGQAHEILSEEGSLKDASWQPRIDQVAHRLVEILKKLGAD